MSPPGGDCNLHLWNLLLQDPLYFSVLPLMMVLKSPTGIWIGKSTAASRTARKMYHPAQHVTKVEAPAP